MHQQVISNPILASVLAAVLAVLGNLLSNVVPGDIPRQVQQNAFLIAQESLSYTKGATCGNG